ncbi:uncharacterized protein LOC127585821 [Pristis pectinata]|uniref:uncharacterized protein LOC127585821 n=1 Tax=Pristis pectinata TaxID=685728 RepID=UPI00223D7A5B|nr:uncharacterized protein LOC127585821 [Pristis pectinata]
MALKHQVESWTEETICPICLDFFTDPVSLECGHNFCRSCITRCWGKEARIACPECRAEFQEITLKVNRALMRLAEKARKLNLNPTEKESKLHCEEHQEELKLFCETDKKLICVICRDAREHKSHNFTPIKEAVEAYKHQVKSSLTSLTERQLAILKMEQQQKQKIFEIQDQSRSLESHISAEFSKMHQSLTEKEQRLIRDLRKQEELSVDLMERNLREIQTNLTSIEEELSMLQKQMEQKDGMIFLKEESCRKRRVGDDQILTVKDGALTMEEFAGPLPFPVWKEMFDDIHPVSVTLDVGTAGPGLEVSEDRRSVRRTRTRTELPDTRKRFTLCPCVLGSEGFASGRHYWEVKVAQNKGWGLGVAAESVKREGWVELRPETGFWIIGRVGDELNALTSPPFRLPAGPIPGRVGVYLSYESGTASFYCVDTKSHLHTFTGNKFTDKIYPFFETWDENQSLRICSCSAPDLLKGRVPGPASGAGHRGCGAETSLTTGLFHVNGTRPHGRFVDMCQRTFHPPLWQRMDRAHWTFPETAGVQQFPESESILDQEVLGVNMASKHQVDSWTQEAICPICLEFFTDPVSLECGHNFCRPCITRCWEKEVRNSCPECREEFQEILLRVNRALARLAEKARKLKLIPIEKESKLHCEEHQEELKLFCETDKKLICVICRDSREHKSHKFLPIKEAVEIHKEQVKSSLTSLTERKLANLKMEQQQKQKISEIRDQSRGLESHISSEFTEIHENLTEKEQRLIRDLRKQEERVVDLMERNLREIQRNLTSIQEEHSTLQKQMEQKDGAIFLKEESCRKRRIGDDQTLTVREGALMMEEFAGPLPFPVWREMLDDIHPVSVTLDVGTANPWLEVSEDRKCVRLTGTRRDLPDTRKRFTFWSCVLGSEGFTSGRHYWEVEVAGSRGWCLGVAAESVERKRESQLTLENGVWTIGRWGNELYVLTSPRSRLPAGPIPGRVGVYVSYETGTVSFYSVDTKSHLHTFTGNKFMEKLYPFFVTWDENQWLRICSSSTPGLQNVRVPGPASKADLRGCGAVTPLTTGWR